MISERDNQDEDNISVLPPTKYQLLTGHSAYRKLPPFTLPKGNQANRRFLGSLVIQNVVFLRTILKTFYLWAGRGLFIN